MISSLLLNYYLYEFKYTDTVRDISKFADLHNAVISGKLSEEELKMHAYNIYKCSDSDSSVGKIYKQIIDLKIHELFEELKTASFESKTYLTEVLDKCKFHVMNSLRDTDRQVIVELR